MPTSASRPASSHRSVLGELGVAELLAGLGVRERHRHVEVGAARVEGRLEDRRVEAGVDRVQDRVGTARRARARRSHEASDASTAAAAEAIVAVRLDRAPRAILVDVGEHHPLEEVAALRDGGDRRSDSPRPDDENAHPAARYVR